METTTGTWRMLRWFASSWAVARLPVPTLPSSALVQERGPSVWPWWTVMGSRPRSGTARSVAGVPITAASMTMTLPLSAKVGAGLWGDTAVHAQALTLTLCCSRRLFPAGRRRWSLRRAAGGAAGPGLGRCVRGGGGHEGGAGGVQGAGLWGGAGHRRQWPICGGIGIAVGRGLPVQWHGAPPQCLCPASAPQPGLQRRRGPHLLP